MTREEAIKLLIRIKDRINFEVTDAQRKMDALNMAIKALERKQGEWEVIDYAEPKRYGCSICRIFVWHPTNYCPNCGAEMKEKA